jgi:tetratricopeptide (TPR) repeat protein
MCLESIQKGNGALIRPHHRTSIKRTTRLYQVAVTKASELASPAIYPSAGNGMTLAEFPTRTASALTVVGEADRAFRLGILLEKNGQARKASASFHEAATLYQCYLDSKSEFAHITSLPDDECVSILAYTCMRLAFLNQDALGDPNAAVRLYKEAVAIDPSPSAASYDGMGESLEASCAGSKLDEACEAYKKALELSPDNRIVQFHLALALERLGRADEAEPLYERLRRSESIHSCLVDSWGYVRWHTRNIPTRHLNLFRGTRDMLELALTAAMPLIERGGLVCEFGVGGGRSFRMAQEILPLDATMHGFDTVREVQRYEIGVLVCDSVRLMLRRHTIALSTVYRQSPGVGCGTDRRLLDGWRRPKHGPERALLQGLVPRHDPALPGVAGAGRVLGIRQRRLRPVHVRDGRARVLPGSARARDRPRVRRVHGPRHMEAGRVPRVARVL